MMLTITTAAAINIVYLMKILLQAYGHLDLIKSVDFHGRNPQLIAASQGYIEVIRFCLSICVSLEVLDVNKCTPLHLAAEGCHLGTVECLSEASNYSRYALNEQGKTAFALAVENERSNVLDSLHLGDALRRAARVGDVNGIKSCISEWANVNGKHHNGWTALHRVAFKGEVESVKALLSHGGEINVVDDDGYTALHCAVEARSVEVALLLIGHDAKSNVKSLKGIGRGLL